jgi:hypothetical protein
MLAENLATQVVNNGSFNCNAAKILVVSESWPQRQELLTTLQEILQEMPTRRAYYPGAQDRFAKLTAGKTVTRLGRAGDGELPWTLIRDVNPKNAEEPLFSTEPFCSIISEVALPEKDAAEFVQAAARFANDRLWGTLSCSMYMASADGEAAGRGGGGRKSLRPAALRCGRDQSLAGGGLWCDDAAVGWSSVGDAARYPERPGLRPQHVHVRGH